MNDFSSPYPLLLSYIYIIDDGFNIVIGSVYCGRYSQITGDN